MRRNDLDALRAIAMLLGIVLHGMMSFIPDTIWMVQDKNSHPTYHIVFSAIHGFRMPLFFLISGFFTAMLWRKKGLKQLIKHRFKRIFLPLLAGFLTIIPLTFYIIFLTSTMESPKVEGHFQESPLITKAEDKVFSAIKTGNINTVKESLYNNVIDPNYFNLYKTSLINLAVLHDQPTILKLLIEKGADVNARLGDSGTALHMATLFGHAECTQLLINHGAEVNALNYLNISPLDYIYTDSTTTQLIAGFNRIVVNETSIKKGRKQCLKFLQEAQATHGSANILFLLLTTIPIFQHLWFLWYLCWMIVLFSMVVYFIKKVNFSLPTSFLLSPIRYFFLIPITLFFQYHMGLMVPVFGPDTFGGLLPMPNLFFYYCLFFFFGALYWESNDTQEKLGRHWKVTLPFSLLLVFPLGYLTTHEFDYYHRPLSILTQSLFVWLMCFSFIGVFRSYFTKENKILRYLSDASYWLYLTHMPLIIYLQAYLKNWDLSPYIKLVLILSTTCFLLLFLYQILIRYTFIGTFLNGPKKLPLN